MKRGSKVLTNCPICGKEMTCAGVVGHCRWKHGRDWKRPLFEVERPMTIGEARRKAQSYDELCATAGGNHDEVAALLRELRQTGFTPGEALEWLRGEKKQDG